MLATLHQEIARWETAKACAEKIDRDRRRTEVVKPVVRKRRAIPQNGFGALMAFVRQHEANPGALKPTATAKLLMPIAKREGLQTSVQSLATAVRRVRQPEDAAITGMASYIQRFGPMPFASIRGWLEESHPELKTGTHHPTLVRLNVLQQAGRVVNENGAFKAVPAQ